MNLINLNKVQPQSFQSPYPPAIAACGGQLWCAIAAQGSGAQIFLGSFTPPYDAAGNQYFSTFQPAVYGNQVIATNNYISMAEFEGNLHLIVNEDDYYDQTILTHYIFKPFLSTVNGTTSLGVWTHRYPLGINVNAPTALASGAGFLCLAFLNTGDNNKLSYATYRTTSGWTAVKDTNEASWACPALFMLNGAFHMVFSQNDTGRALLEDVYNPTTDTWTRIASVGESSASGVSACTVGQNPFIAFPANDTSNDILIDVYSAGGWQRQINESAGYNSTQPVALATLEGQLYMVYNGDNGQVDWACGSLNNPNDWNWMSFLPDTTYASMVTMPGTHDSGTSLGKLGWVATQTLTIGQQLMAGVRYFDIRVGLEDDELWIVHGGFGVLSNMGITAFEVFTTFYEFLINSPGETLFVQIKDEIGGSKGAAVSAAIYNLIVAASTIWITSDANLQLSEMRGKIQLFRRFQLPTAAGATFGYDLTGDWPPNSSGPLTTNSQTFYIQDMYEIKATLAAIVDTKWNDEVEQQLNDAVKDPSSQNWYLNFTSATNIPFVTPWEIAAGAPQWTTDPDVYIENEIEGVNSNLYGYIAAAAQPCRLGIIIMDYPTANNLDCITAIYLMNFESSSAP